MKRETFFAPLEVKFANDAAEGSFAGYGSVFGIEDRGGDLIQKGAFKETLRDAKKGAWPPMLLQHGGGLFSGSTMDSLPIGVWTSIAEDDKGLHVEGQIATKTSRGAEVYELLKMQPRPAINGLSIGYRVKEFSNGTKVGEPRRTLKKVDLFEISLVTMPMNPLATVDAVKGAAGRITTIREFEEFLREAGFSRAAAKAIAAGGFKAADPRDEDEADVVALLRRNIATLSTR